MPFVIKARPRNPRPEDNRPEVNLPSAESEVENIVNTATGDLSDAATSKAVRDAISTRNYEAIVNAFPWEQTADTLGLTTDVFDSVIKGSIGNGFPKTGFKGVFDYTDPRSIEWARTQSARLVTAIGDNTRLAIRQTIAQSFTENRTVDETARALREIVGLNDRQFLSYSKFRSNLREKLDAGEITVSQFEKMAERQYKKLRNYRARMIARHEIITAEDNGRYLGFQQSVEAGWSSPNAMKRWSTSTDERTCAICAPMNGKSVQWDKTYPNGVFNPPAHIMCRCTISLLEPDSSLAQSFMPPATPPAVPTKNLPMPDKITTTPAGLRTIEDAVGDATRGGVSHAQYDAGDIEDLDLTFETVEFDGQEYTEVRMKLTDDAKQRLLKEIDADPDSPWRTDKGVAIIDKKTGKTIRFRNPDSDMFMDADFRELKSINGDDPDFAFLGFGDSTKTYTIYQPDGTAIRVLRSREHFAVDGQVRIMIPGKATPAQVESAMRTLRVTAPRYPTPADVEALKTNRIISLFKPEAKKYMRETKEEIIETLRDRWGLDLKDVVTTFDSRGRMTFKLPDEVVEKIVNETGLKGIQHRIGVNHMMDPERQIDDVVKLFTDKPRLVSTTGRVQEGIPAKGMSMASDIKTGGADFTFTSPIKEERYLLGGGNESPFTIQWQPRDLLSRTDWYAASNDSYGVLNPDLFDQYWMGTSDPNRPDWFLELARARSGNGEIMFRDGIDLTSASSMSLPSRIIDTVKDRLRAAGITEWNGIPIDDFFVTRA